MKTIYPFKIVSIDNGITIMSNATTDNYFEVFEKHQYYGNGYCWESHIQQILENENPSLLKHIRFKAESDFFFASIDSTKNFNAIMKIIVPIFQDYEKLEKYIIAANRDKIDA